MAKIINTAKIYKSGGTSGGVGGPTLPAGLDGQIQWNNSGIFGASSDLYWDKINNRLSVASGTSPAARVHVRSQGNLSTDRAFRVDDTTSTERFSVRGNGDVNIEGTNQRVSVGLNVVVSGSFSVGFGRVVTVTGVGSVACGISTNCNGDNSIVFGLLNNTNAGEAMAIGQSNNNSRYRSILFGRNLTFSNNPNNENTIGFGYSVNTIIPKLNFRSHTFNHLLLGYAPEEYNYSSSNGSNWFAIANGTPPAGQIDAFQMYSDDITPGNAAPHFRTEAGQVIRLYQETTSVGSSTFVANTGTTVNNNSTFDGYTIAQVVQALRNLGILA